MSDEPLRVAIAEDHPIFRDGLAAAIAALEGMKVVGVASTGAEAVRLAHELTPDVFLMDLHMPEMNGIEATREIVAAVPATAVLVLTMLDDDESVFAAMRAGAHGYLVKGAERRDIARAVEAVGRGEIIFGPAVARQALAAFAGGRARTGPFPDLTEREHEILDLVARGLTNQAIASRLVLSDKTVRNHISNIFMKLRVSDRASAVVRAREAGLGRDPA
jgi:DNA-binding NarL/FixJ family response regulator